MTVIKDQIVQKNTGRSFVVKNGRLLRISAESIVDFVVFNLDNLKERFDQARTKVNQGKIYISKNDVLYSKSNNVMMTITEDTYKGTHDLQYGMCSKSTYDTFWRLRDKEPWKSYFIQSGINKREDLPDHGCWENLTDALNGYGIAPEDIPSPFNLFQSYEIAMPRGTLIRCLDRDRPEPGKPALVEFRAEMNCVVGVSACPESGKMGKAKAIRIELLPHR
jgi:uncharacterized protein YcgI (DUF1989 family)